MKEAIKKQLKGLFVLWMMVLTSVALYAQQGTIKGTVKDADGEPIIGANIFIEGTTEGTVSDVEGKFTLPVSEVGTIELSVSFIGYLKETQSVTIAEGASVEVNFMLVEDLQQLSEVVVIGYGTQKKSDLTGAIASVKTEELTKLATTNVQQALQGRAAGVLVTSNSGAPGDPVTVRIRGISTVNNSDPLYVVDGFPTGEISYLNPSDIESMEILKDASATAIYGNRGANGVILITTKKGKAHEPTINFNMYVGTQQANKTIPLLNAMEYGNAKLAAYENLAEIRNRPNTVVEGQALYDTIQWVLANNYEGTDWQNEVLRQGKIQNYELGVSGGSDRYTYNASGSFNRNDGIVINSWMKRYILRYAGQMKVNKYINTSMSLSYRNIERINYNHEIWGQGILPNAQVADPISTVYLPDTNWYSYVVMSETTNPVAAADRAKNRRFKTDQFVGNIGIDIEPFKGLVISSKVGGDINWNRTMTYIPVYTIGAKDLSTQSSLDEIYQRTFAWNNSNYINYNKIFGLHDLNIMIGQEWSAYNSFRLRYVVFDVPDNPSLYYPHFSPNTTTPSFNGDFSPSNRPAYTTKLSSFFGRIFYGYDNRYLITLNLRYDGASQIDEEYRWGTFPSFSVGWNIKNEKFMENIRFLSALKLRYGWGRTGNINSVNDPYGRFAVVTPGLDMVGLGDQALTGSIQTVNPNPGLQWEESVQSNYAIDFGFLGNKLNGTIDFFMKTTTGMIVIIDPPYFAGSLASAGNYGEMENKGVEISLNYRNFDREFKYEIGGNFTWLDHPMITKWADPYTTGIATKIQNITRTAEGEEMAHFYGYRTDGLLTQEDIDNSYTIQDGDTIFTYDPNDAWWWFPGQLKIVDLNGDGIIDNEDKTNIGSANPDFYYGININLMYKGFDLIMFFQGVYGNELINGLNVWSKFPDEGDNNLSTEVLDAWTPENPNSDVPRLVQSNPIMQQRFNDYIVEDASYLRLKNIQLGYTLPKNIVGKLGIENLRIYVSGENLLTFTKYSGFDPEVGLIQYNNALQRNDPLSQGIDQATYPVAKKYLFGVNVSF